jgi:hypothetical protein
MKIARIAPGLSRSLLLSAAGFGLAGAACSSDDLPTSKLGNTSDLLVGTDVKPSAPSAPRVPVVTAKGAVDPFLIGDWVGRAEDLFHPANADGSRPTYRFPSGSSEIYLHVEIEDGAVPKGTLRFGAREAPVPQVGVSYGAGINYYYADFLTNRQGVPPVEGFTYHLEENVWRLAGVDGQGYRYSAIALGYDEDEAFDEWCTLQPPLPLGDGQFSCVGAAGYGGGDPASGVPCDVTLGDGSHRDMDCNLVELCSTLACSCDEHSCFARNEGLRNTVWLAREGDQLIGNLSGAAFEYGEVGHFMPIGAIRFDREEP